MIQDHKPPVTPTRYLQPPFSLPLVHSPVRWAKEPPRRAGTWVRDLHGRVQIIRIVVRDADTPPAGHARLRQVQGQDNHNRADGQADIQARRGDVVETHPPAAVLVPDVLVEDEADDAPCEVVERCSGRDLAGPTEDERRVEVAEVHLGEHAGETVEYDRCGGADEPEPLEVCVDGARAEDPLWAYQAPYDGSVEEDTAVGAIEFVGLVLGADVRDGAAEGPAEDGDLHDGGPEGGDGLSYEHGTPGNFHVHAEFEILGEVEALGHGDVAVGLEEHHCDGPAGLDVSRYELAVGHVRIAEESERETNVKTFRPIWILFIPWIKPIGTNHTRAMMMDMNQPHQCIAVGYPRHTPREMAIMEMNMMEYHH